MLEHFNKHEPRAKREWAKQGHGEKKDITIASKKTLSFKSHQGVQLNALIELIVFLGTVNVGSALMFP